MASLYKKPQIVTDPKTGQKIKVKSKKWWGQYRDADRRRRRVPLALDKVPAQAILNKIVRDVERQKAGLIDMIALRFDTNDPVGGTSRAGSTSARASGREA
jgi:hypothetical protein